MLHPDSVTFEYAYDVSKGAWIGRALSEINGVPKDRSPVFILAQDVDEENWIGAVLDAATADQILRRRFIDPDDLVTLAAKPSAVSAWRSFQHYASERGIDWPARVMEIEVPMNFTVLAEVSNENDGPSPG